MILQGRLLIDPETKPEIGWVFIEGSAIRDLGSGDPPEAPHCGSADSIICPGFIDAHLHLPQITVIGCRRPSLLQWLDEVVYPAEMRWLDPALAAADIDRACRLLVRSGTLGCAAYLSSHSHGSDIIERMHARLPLRMIAGQTLMDRQAPPGLISHPIRTPAAPNERLAFSVNPRFAVSCSDALLAEAARLAQKNCFVQTHLAEQIPECDLVRSLFPDARYYTDVYDHFGLLTERTLLAHCVHLSDAEWQLIDERRSVVVHCPTANLFLQSGMFDLDAAHEHGVRLALGSDIAAGPNVAMPEVARAMINVATARRLLAAPEAFVPSPADVWRLITRGNADALGWPDAGRLEPGASADLLVLRPPFPADEHLVSRLIHTWRDEYISHRIVNGRLIGLDGITEPNH